MHVRISEKGRNLLNNKELATEAVKAIVQGKQNLEKGKSISIQDSGISIRLTTTIREDHKAESNNGRI